MIGLIWFIMKSMNKGKQLICTTLVKSYCFLLGINTKKTKFYGITRIYKMPGSKIIFGENLRFRSTNFSNPIGLSRRNTLSTISKNAVIEIGNYCGFSGVAISSASKIEIGDNVMVGANSVITDTDWHNSNPEKRLKNISGESAAIRIEDNVWIGMDVIILKGVSIGKNSVIGAKSLVLDNIPADCIAAGIPCKVIKKK